MPPIALSDAPLGRRPSGLSGWALTAPGRVRDTATGPRGLVRHPTQAHLRQSWIRRDPRSFSNCSEGAEPLESLPVELRMPAPGRTRASPVVASRATRLTRGGPTAPLGMGKGATPPCPRLGPRWSRFLLMGSMTPQCPPLRRTGSGPVEGPSCAGPLKGRVSTGSSLCKAGKVALPRAGRALRSSGRTSLGSFSSRTPGQGPLGTTIHGVYRVGSIAWTWLRDCLALRRRSRR